MKICIVYFSGTGITAELAFTTAESFRRSGAAVDVFRYKKGFEPPPLGEYDLVGFGAPTYSFAAPKMFVRFLRGLEGPKGLRYFLFLTCHSVQGVTAVGMERILNRKGWRRAAELIEGTGINNIRAWRRKTDNPGYDDELTVGGDISSWCRGMIDRTEKDEPFAESNFPGRPVLTIFAWLVTFGWQMAIVEGMRKKADRRICTKCRLCFEKICPSGAITEGPDGYPRIRYVKCAGCSGCVNLCPEGAVYSNVNKNRWIFDKFGGNILRPRN